MPVLQVSLCTYVYELKMVAEVKMELFRNKVSVAGMVVAIALTGSVEGRLCSLNCWKLDPMCAASSFLIFVHSSLALSLSASTPKGKGRDFIHLSYRPSKFCSDY